MKKYKCSFNIMQRDYKEQRDIDFVFYAMNNDEACAKAMKVFLNDRIENETGLLDNALYVVLLKISEEIESEKVS